MQETLDPALTRPGRFDRRVAVPMPDVRGRVEILNHYLKVRPNWQTWPAAVILCLYTLSYAVACSGPLSRCHEASAEVWELLLFVLKTCYAVGVM